MPDFRAAVPVLAGLLLLAPSGLAQVQPMRAVAEWEPAIGAQVRYPWGVPSSVLVEIARDDLLFVYTSSANQATANSQLMSFGVNMANVRYLVVNTNSIWTRDWGPPAAFDSAGSFFIIDPLFRGYPISGFTCGSTSLDPGTWTSDDVAPAALATFQGVQRLVPPAYLTGGNFMPDGAGRALYTCLLLDENAGYGISATSARNAMRDFLGVTEHIQLPNFETSGIQHIDCAVKQVDPTTFLVKRVPTTHSSFTATNTIATQLASTIGPGGRNFEVRRLDMVNSSNGLTNYTNSLILNTRNGKKVLVPTWGGSAAAGDAAALQAFRDAMPGYQVIPFLWTGWRSNDALHCRVRAVWDPQMLHVAHTRVARQLTMGPGGELISATVRPYSGQALLPGFPQLKYRAIVGGTPEPWRTRTMISTGNASFVAAMPRQLTGATVEYAIIAQDQSGRSEAFPPPGLTGPVSFTVTSGGSPACDVIDASGDGAIAPSDIFAFLNRYFAAGPVDPRADFDGDGVRAPADLFAFLNAYFAGC